MKAFFFNLSARWGWVVNAMPRPLYPREETRYPLYRRLGGLQGRSGRVRKNLDLILDRIIHGNTCRKALRTFTHHTELLDSNIKLTFHKSLVFCMMVYACPAWVFCGRHLPVETAAPAKKAVCTTGKLPRRGACRVAVYTRLV